MSKRKYKVANRRLMVLGAASLLVIIVLFGLAERSNKIKQFFNTPVSNSATSEIKIQVPDNKNWYEYNAKCEGLNKNLKIFFPVGWKTSGEQDITDNITGEPGTKDYTDYINMVSQCQVLGGYKDAPGGHQDPCTENDYGIVSVGAIKVEPNQDIDYWKNTYSDKQNYSWINTISESTLNGRKYLTINGNDSDFTEYEIVNNSYLITVNHFLCLGPGGTNNDKYFKQTGFEIFKRLIFK